MRWQILILVLLLITSITAVSAEAVNKAPILIQFASNGSTINVTGDYSSEVDIFTIAPPSDEKWTISRLIVNIVDDGTFDSGAYGNNIDLVNGIQVVLNKSNTLTDITNERRILTNADWGRYAYDTAIDSYGVGNEQLHVRWTFSKSGTYIELDGKTNDSIGIVVNDDFTALQEHYFMFQGFKGSEKGVDGMASLSITLFILVINLVFFLLPFFKRRFAENDFTNIILRRCCWLLAIFLAMLNSSIVATIAGEQGLPLTNEMFRYLILFGWGGYLFMAFVILKTLFDVLQLYKFKQNNKRMGDD